MMMETDDDSENPMILLTVPTLPEINSSHLKIGLNAPKGNNRIPTIHFQMLLLLSFREWLSEGQRSPRESRKS